MEVRAIWLDGVELAIAQERQRVATGMICAGRQQSRQERAHEQDELSLARTDGYLSVRQPNPLPPALRR
jgi:hypothetical protein